MKINSPTNIERIIFAGIIALLVFAPLAFGSVHVWAYSIIEFGVFLLLALWFVDRLIVSRSENLTWVKTPVNLMLVLLLALIGLQLLPLPSSVMVLVSPHTHADKTQFFALLGRAADVSTDGPAWMALTYYVHATLVEWLKIGAYFGMFFLVVNTLKSKQQIDILVYCLIFLGLFEAVYSIYQVFTDNPKVWWWTSRFGRSQRASGTFIGANHFAAYMGMIVCLAFGFLIAQKKKSKQMQSGLGGFRASFQKLINLFSPESSQPKIILFSFVAIIMGGSILLSGSRGGIISFGVALFASAILFSAKRGYRKYAIFALCLCLLIAGFGIKIGIDPTLKRFEQTQGLYDRLEITRTIFPMILDYPILGLGWGNFKYLYPRYIVDKDQVSDSGYAHNDWVEAGIETGFVGGIIIVAAFLICLYKMLHIWRKRRNLHALGIGAGVIAGMLAISIHSYFDFNMHIPANPLTLAAILGIGYAAIHRQGHGYSESFFYRKRTLQLSRPLRMVVAAVVILVLGGLFHLTWRHAAAEAACPTEWNSTMNLNWKPELADIDLAISRNAGNFEYHHKRALHFMSLSAETEEEKNALRLEAKKDLEQALRRNPARGILWYNLGYLYSFSRYDLTEYLNKWLPLADDCFDAAIQCAPMDEYLLFNIGRYWVWRSQLLPEKDMPVLRDSPQMFKDDGIQKFQDLFQRYLILNPGRWKAVLDSVWDIYPQDRVAFGIVPTENAELKSLVLQEIAKRAEKE